MEDISFPQGSFDVILCSASLPYLWDLEGTLTRMRSWLAGTGRLIFNTLQVCQVACIAPTLSCNDLFVQQEPYSIGSEAFYEVMAVAGVPVLHSGLKLGTAGSIRQLLLDSGFTFVKVSWCDQFT